MTPDEAVLAAADRLRSIDWERHGDKAWSKAALLKEYFRRAARWAAACGSDSPDPFFDIASCVDPGVRADQRIVDVVVATVETRRGGRTVTRLVPLMLHWAALRGTPGVTLPSDLEDPYEPLFQLFERGGGFHIEKGDVDLEWKSVRITGWRNRANDPPLQNLTSGYLDEVDRDGSTAQFGYVIGPLE